MKRLLFVLWFTVTFLNSWIMLGIDFDGKDIEAEIMKRLVLKHSKYQDKNFYHTEITKEIISQKEISNLCNEFIKTNYLTFDYLIKDLTSSFLKNRDKSIDNPDEVIQEFNKYVTANKDFLKPVVQMMGLFIKSRGYGVTSIVEQPKKVFTLDQIKAIAVRNILPYRMTKEGKPAVRICVAGEGYIDYPDRNKKLEAFLFESVMNGLKNGNLDKKIQEFMKIIAKLNLSTDNDTAVTRAQGAFWWFFFQDKDFEKILLDNYNNKKDYLPFDITIN